MSIATPVAEPDARAMWSADGTAGRLRDSNLTDTDRNFALAIHLSPFSYIVVGPLALIFPLILWLVRKDESVFSDDHGREAVNFGISFILWNIVLALTIVGIILLPVLWVVGFVNLIRGAMAAGRGEYFRYPVTIRFL